MFKKIINSRLIKRILSLILPVLIIIWLLAQISVNDIVDLFSNLSYRWVVVGIVFYLITNINRAYRLQLLLPGQATRIRTLLAIVIAQSMFNNILPARTGELSLLYLLGKHENVALDRSAVALIVARVFDYLAVAFIFIVAALISIEFLPAFASNIIFIVLGVMLLTIIILFLVAWLKRPALRLLHAILKRIGWGRYTFVQRVFDKMGQLLVAFEDISLKLHVFVFVWSLLTWFSTFAWFYAFMRSLGIEIEATTLIVGSTFAVLSKAIPFISIGGLGAHEAGWTVGFVLVGFDKTTAISSGFAVNILTLLSSVLWGLWALLSLKSTPSLSVHPEQPAPMVEQDTLSGRTSPVVQSEGEAGVVS